tara:strand:+ start:3829 stop:4041 length:213 start_codon:yes stop_codon:yes gene_type:complete
MSYELDKNKVTELLFHTLKKCNKEYLAVEELIDYHEEHYPSFEELHVKKISLLGQMKGIREDLQKFENSK